jgi:hypothetical protein
MCSYSGWHAIPLKIVINQHFLNKQKIGKSFLEKRNGFDTKPL